MSAGWVAGSVRAQAMARRCIGTAGARSLAALPWGQAIDLFARSPYGERFAPGERDVIAAGRAVAETLLWNVRVLAGWLPPAGAQVLRVLVAGFEISNVDQHLRVLRGEPGDPPLRLGAVATAWPSLRATGSPEELRSALARSPWRDPGAATPRDIHIGMTLAWAERVADRVTPARAWAAGAAALLVARERFAVGRPLTATAAATAERVLGAGPAGADSLEHLSQELPRRAAWVMAGISDAHDLCRAEVRWWQRVRAEGAALVDAAEVGPVRVVGAVGLLAADAWLVRAAVEAAARGGGALELFDAMA